MNNVIRTIGLMAASQKQLLRELRVAFTAAELEMLQAEKAFNTALTKSSDSAEEVKKLIELGGALLAERDRSKSKLRNSRRKC